MKGNEMKTDTVDYELDREIEAIVAEPRNAEPPPKPPKAPTKSRHRSLIIIGAVLAIVAAGAYLWLGSLNRESTDNAQVDGHIVPVSSKIYGNIAEVLVDDNQTVKKGQVLVRIDARDHQAKVDQAKAALAYAQSQAAGAQVVVPMMRETTQSNTSSASAQLSAMQADYERAKVDYDRAANADVAYARANEQAKQATYEKAQADLRRMKPLVDKEEISHLQYDSYVAAARVGESELQAAKEKLAASLQDAATRKSAVLAAQARVEQAHAGVQESRANWKQVDVRAADARSASAGVRQARANLDAAELNLSYTTIVAPMDGVVTRKSAETGQIVQPGQGLMMIVPMNDIWVTANFKETQLANVRAGQKAEVKVDLSGKTYTGHVDSIASATGARLSLLPPENATGNFVKVVQRIPVKIVLDPIPGGNTVLRPGMNVDATILTK